MRCNNGSYTRTDLLQVTPGCGAFLKTFCVSEVISTERFDFATSSILIKSRILRETNNK